MARSAFYSFHYVPDNWRASQVRNIGAVSGNSPVTDNDWEEVKRGGDAAIKRWIAGQMRGRSVTIVLVGAGTAGRKWINYEIAESWNAGMGVVGVRIHRLKDRLGNQSTSGSNPFEGFTVGDRDLSSIVKLYDPPFTDSAKVYEYISNNLAAWADESVRIRSRY